VALLPLSRLSGIAETRYLRNRHSIHQDKEPAIHRIARGIADAVAEDREVQRLLYGLRMNPARYVLASHRAPDSYMEFLIWTSGALLHEPSARDRAAGRNALG
jgi:hypothetical protein